MEKPVVKPIKKANKKPKGKLFNFIIWLVVVVIIGVGVGLGTYYGIKANAEKVTMLDPVAADTYLTDYQSNKIDFTTVQDAIEANDEVFVFAYHGGQTFDSDDEDQNAIDKKDFNEMISAAKALYENSKGIDKVKVYFIDLDVSLNATILGSTFDGEVSALGQDSLSGLMYIKNEVGLQKAEDKDGNTYDVFGGNSYKLTTSKLKEANLYLHSLK